MNDTRINYGNWVPKKMIIIAGCLTIVLTIISILLYPFTFNTILLSNSALFPFFLVLTIIVWIIDLFCFIISVFFTSLYRAFDANNCKLQDDIRNIVLDKLQWNGEGKALDIGTGSGYLAINLAKFNGKSEAVGVDNWGKSWAYSIKTCEQNAEKEGVKERTSFQRADAANLPFEDESFDAIVSNLVYHNIVKVRDKSKLFKEALRVLKKGGTFSIQDKVKSKAMYGNFNKFEKKLKEIGLAELNYMDTNYSIKMPRSARMELKTMGIFYGIK